MVLSNLTRFQCLLRSSYRMQLHTACSPLLAGHSKWANIKHIKAQKDGEKAAIFTRLSRQIRLAVQEGGSPDPNLNSVLRSVVDEALRKNMPMTTIQNNIKKCEQNKTELKRYILELKYKQKVFALCVVYTENLPQFKMEMAPIVRKAGAAYNNVVHLFDEDGLIEATFTKSREGIDLQDQATEDAIDCGAEDIEIINESEGILNFVCRPRELNQVRRAIEGKGYTIQSADSVYIPKNTIKLSPEESKSYQAFVEKLQALPGMDDIYDNVEFEER